MRVIGNRAERGSRYCGGDLLLGGRGMEDGICRIHVVFNMFKDKANLDLCLNDMCLFVYWIFFSFVEMT